MSILNVASTNLSHPQSSKGWADYSSNLGYGSFWWWAIRTTEPVLKRGEQPRPWLGWCWVEAFACMPEPCHLSTFHLPTPPPAAPARLFPWRSAGEKLSKILNVSKCLYFVLYLNDDLALYGILGSRLLALSTLKILFHCLGICCCWWEAYCQFNYWTFVDKLFSL